MNGKELATEKKKTSGNGKKPGKSVTAGRSEVRKGLLGYTIMRHTAMLVHNPEKQVIDAGFIAISLEVGKTPVVAMVPLKKKKAPADGGHAATANRVGDGGAAAGQGGGGCCSGGWWRPTC